ncbi:MAG TPA: OmpA family protein [Chryseosolibacter sp.]|nr:OmpA family protein [Chryseosolibacter sp.]
MEATKAYDDARDNYVMAAEADTTYEKANFEAGHIYLITINKQQAVKYLLRVYREDPEYKFDLEYMIGKAYQYGMEWDKAIEFYNRYKEKLAKKPNYQGKDKTPLSMVERSLHECANGKAYTANPRDHSILNIGDEINSAYDDYGPVLNEAGTEIVFTTRRKDGNMNENVFDDNKPWEDVFIAQKEGGKWSYATNIGAPINTPTHNSNTALSADGKILFLYTDDGAGDILQSDLQADGTWSVPEALPGVINSSYSEKSVSISKDESTLYFSSNRPGGFGGLDIYRATKNSNGEWSSVKNLGPKINTEYDEDGPFIDYDGVTLFFSSRGHEGMGGYDIFKSIYTPDDNKWSEPENLGYPINTPDEDIYFIAAPDGKTAYYSSLKEEGMGYQDIYVITIPEGIKNTDLTPVEPVVAKKDTATTTIADVPNDQVKKDTVVAEVPVETNNTENVVKTPVDEPKKIVPLTYIVKVVDENNTPLSAKVKMVGAKDNVIVKSTQENNVTEFSVTSDAAKDYRLSAELDGYVFYNQNVKIPGAGTEPKSLSQTVILKKIAVNVTSVLRNIYFDFNRATFKTESYAELNKLENMLRQNSSMKIEIGGHTDGVGSANYNKLLSQKRAEAVKDYLIEKGIDARRVKAVGYGKSRPLASNDDEDEGRELNRRVEFKILSK